MCFIADSITGTNLYKLYLIEQFKFFWEKDSVAEANIEIYWTPTYIALYMPLILGTKHGYETFIFLEIELKSSFELAICGIHFGETNDPTYIVFKPL